jgi:hypothetical protein
MLKRILDSPLTGALAAIVSALWEGFWLIGPPLGLTKSDSRSYLAFGLLALLLSGGQSFYALKRENKELRDKVFSAPQLAAQGISSTATNVGAEFHHIKIANLPKGSLGRQTAEKVAGTVEICDENGKSLALRRIHRWAGSPQVPGFPYVADLQLPIDIEPNGISHPLDVVLKFDGDLDFFTHNNESVAKYGYRDPNYQFPPGTYIASISVSGKNVVAQFRCRIINRGRNTKLDVQLLD